MVDIHHHLLWGLDDGARDFETSLAMAKTASADGVTHVVCTPHANNTYVFDPVINREKASELQARLEQENIPIAIGLGCDFHLSYDNVIAAKADPARFSVNGHNYIMVELPDFAIPQGMTETFYELQLAGLTPILTHPERNPTLQANQDRLAGWLRAGLLVQVTGDSVTGQMGKAAEKMAHQLLAKRWVHFLATDAHSVNRRPPRLSQARDLVAKKYGTAYAHSLVDTNPRAVFNGQPFHPAEEPIGLYEEPEHRPWWRRLLN